MAAKTNAYSADWLKLVFNATTWGTMAQNAASAPVTTLWVSLLSSAPAASGDQTTNEVAYTGYARVGVARTTGGWVVTNNSVSPVANITFPFCNGGSATATAFGVGTSQTGAGELLYYGGINPQLNISTGTVPQLTPSSTIQET